MSKEMTETDDFVIKIPKHMWEGINNSRASKEKKLDFDILERTGVSITWVERDSVYGKTQIQTFTLEEKEHRKKILDLLNNPTLYARISKIFQYLYELGCDSADNEKRNFAARAVSMLSDYLPFVDLEAAILTKWADKSSFGSNQSAALALVNMIQDGQHQKNAINLLDRWSNERFIRFANIVLMAYYEIAYTYPNDALNAVKNILSNEKTLAYLPQEVLSDSNAEESTTKLSWETITLKIFWLINKLYLNYPLCVIETLHIWFQERISFSLTMFAAITFLSIIHIKDIAHDDIKRTRTVAYLYDLWEGKKSPERQQLQQLTTNSVYSWAKTVLEMEATDPDRVACQKFFHELYQKCALAKQNRLDFHLRRWQNQLQQSGKSNVSSPQTLNFLSLIPDAKQASNPPKHGL